MIINNEKINQQLVKLLVHYFLECSMYICMCNIYGNVYTPFYRHSCCINYISVVLDFVKFNLNLELC